MLSHSAPEYVIKVYAGNRKYKTNFYRNICKYDVTAKYPSEKTKHKNLTTAFKGRLSQTRSRPLFSSSSLGSTSIRRCFCNTHLCGNVSVDCSSSCGSPSGSISNKTQLFDVCVEMYCFHKITTYADRFFFHFDGHLLR